MRTPTRHRIALSFACLLLLGSSALHTQTGGAQVDPTIPVIDGGLGACTADFTVTDSNQNPVYDAKIRVHIAYRFMSLHKLDLEAGTNASGKARFIGLPEKSKQGLFFRASGAAGEGSAFDDPAKTCKAQFTIQLEKKSQ